MDFKDVWSILWKMGKITISFYKTLICRYGCLWQMTIGKITRKKNFEKSCRLKLRDQEKKKKETERERENARKSSDLTLNSKHTKCKRIITVFILRDFE